MNEPMTLRSIAGPGLDYRVKGLTIAADAMVCGPSVLTSAPSLEGSYSPVTRRSIARTCAASQADVGWGLPGGLSRLHGAAKDPDTRGRTPSHLRGGRHRRCELVCAGSAAR